LAKYRTQQVNPNDGSALDYLLMVWPAALSQLIAVETDRYMYALSCMQCMQRGVSGRCDVVYFLAKDGHHVVCEETGSCVNLGVQLGVEVHCTLYLYIDFMAANHTWIG